MVQADVRDARARLMADDLATARTALEQELADESRRGRAPGRGGGELAATRETEAELEAALREDLPALARAQETWYALSGAARAAPRHRRASPPSASAPADEARGAAPGRDPDELELEADPDARGRGRDRGRGGRHSRARSTPPSTAAQGWRQELAEEERRAVRALCARPPTVARGWPG